MKLILFVLVTLQAYSSMFTLLAKPTLMLFHEVYGFSTN